MKLDLQKIDDRIRRLQELRRIAADPEMSAMLAEFVAESGSAEALRAMPERAPAPPAAMPSVEVVGTAKTGEEAEAAAAANGRSLWGINRR
jgi:hypothetical protein